MQIEYIYAILSVVSVSLISLVGALVLLLKEEKLKRSLFVMVALSVGALFGDAMIHLLPESFENSSNTIATSIYVLIGVMIFFVMEKFLHWNHHHHVEEEGLHGLEIKPLGYLSLISDGMHNFIDGIIIGVSFLVSLPVGIATSLAVMLHEIPQEVGDFGLLLHAGFKPRRALFYNFISALFAVLGTILALLIGKQAATFSQVALPLAAGGFIYIAGSDLVPELHKITDPKKSAIQLLAIIVGIGLMILLLLVG
jgi:zinc and cadmium transporter